MAVNSCAMGSCCTPLYLFVGLVVALLHLSSIGYAADDTPVVNECVTSAGTLVIPSTTIVVCPGEAAHFRHLGDEVKDSNDLFQFLLHTAPYPEMGDIIAYSYDTFFYKPLEAVFGEVNYISAVAGSHAGGNQIDFQDSCLSVSGSIPVIFDRVDVDLLSIPSICANECVDINLQFKGEPPFQFDYLISHNGEEIYQQQIAESENTTIEVCPDQFGASSGIIQFEMLGVRDVRCSLELDSLIIAQVGVSEPSYSLLQKSLCPGETLEINGTVYDQSRPGGTEILANASSSGCDSIVHVDITYLDVTEGVLQETLCEGDRLLINGTWYDEDNPEGTEILTGEAANGCDSIVRIELSFSDVVYSQVNETLCPGGSVEIAGYVLDENQSTAEILLENASSLGCDSVVIAQIDFYQEAESFFEQALCPGEVFEINGETYSIDRPAGTEILTGAASNGCDSIVYVSLDFNDEAYTLIDTLLHPGEYLLVNGTRYDPLNPTGTETFYNSNGCDSIVNVLLTYSPLEIVAQTPDQRLCQGESTGWITIEDIPGAEFPIVVSMNGNDPTVFNTFPVRIQDLPAGEYLLEITDAQTLTGATVVEITNGPELSLDVPPTIQIVEGEQLQIATSANFEVDRWHWDPPRNLSCADCASPVLTAGQGDQAYIVTAFDEFGCHVSANIEVIVSPSFQLYIPNAFTPNSDGRNDMLTIRLPTEFVVEGQLAVFNRNGNCVFRESLQSAGLIEWDGTRHGREVSAGVYVYLVEYRDIEGRLFRESGDITLLR